MERDAWKLAARDGLHRRARQPVNGAQRRRRTRPGLEEHTGTVLGRRRQSDAVRVLECVLSSQRECAGGNERRYGLFGVSFGWNAPSSPAARSGMTASICSVNRECTDANRRSMDPRVVTSSMIGWVVVSSSIGVFMRRCLLLVLIVLFGAATAEAAPDSLPPRWQQVAHDVLKDIVNVNTAQGGEGTTKAAQVVAEYLRRAGFADSDMSLAGPDPKNLNLIVRFHGTRTSARPMLQIAHLDTVTANKADWTTDPFVFTEKDGWWYGRGIVDDKSGVGTIVTSLVRWKQEGFTPSRDIVSIITSAEETDAATGMGWIVANRPDPIDAEFVSTQMPAEATSSTASPLSFRSQPRRRSTRATGSKRPILGDTARCLVPIMRFTNSPQRSRRSRRTGSPRSSPKSRVNRF